MLEQELNASRRPAYQLTVDGRDITHLADQRLISLTLTDCRGFEADTLDLVLDDTDGALQIPPKGATIRVAIGWHDTGTTDKGSFTVDEIEHSGAPDQLSIRARSANMRAGLVEKREQSWHATTISSIVNAIALRHSLQAAISSQLASVAIDHIDQTNESDANLLTRLAREHGAIATFKDGHLLFIPSGTGLTASGKPIPAVTIQRQSGDSHRFTTADREAYSAVIANYFDVKAAKRGSVIVNAETAKALREKTELTQREANTRANGGTVAHVIAHQYSSKAKAITAAKAAYKQGGYSSVQASYWNAKSKRTGYVQVTAKGVKLLTQQQATTSQTEAPQTQQNATVTDPTFNDSGNTLTLRHTYASKETALRGAHAAWQRLQRGVASFSITLAHGRPDLMPEVPAQVTGFKPQIDALDWTLTKVTHNLGDQGYTTAIELEVKVDELSE